MGSLIRATSLWGYEDLVTDLGGDPEALLSRFHITSEVARQEDAFVPFESLVRLLETTASELDCPDFGLRLSRWQGLDVLGPIAVIARNTPTVQEALEAIAHYLYVHSPALRLSLRPHQPGSDLTFVYELTELDLADVRQGYELSMAFVVRIIRLLSGTTAGPSSVSFLHEQIGADEAYRDALDCPVHFEQTWCGFELPLGLASREIDSAHPETRRVATRYLESEHSAGTATLKERVVELTRALLPTGGCTIDVIADQLNMNPRTLQRRLRDEGVRYQDLIENERRRQAAKYLAEPGLHLSQITGLLGYAEQSTLNRSCRRWFGKTPRQYRAAL